VLLFEFFIGSHRYLLEKSLYTLQR
jgi:hypothetical protein